MSALESWLGEYGFDRPDAPSDDPLEPAEAGLPLDIVRVYEKQISKTPIPDPIEDRQLADFIHQGKNAEAILEVLEFAEVPIEEEVLQIKAVAEAGEIAKERLVVGHLRLAAYVARLTMGWNPYRQSEFKSNEESVPAGRKVNHLARLAAAPLPLADRIQAANMELMNAAGNYEPGKGATFSTYAMYGLERSIKRAIDYDRTLHLPIHVLEALAKTAVDPKSLTTRTFPPIESLPSRDASETRRYIEELSKPISLEELEAQSQGVEEDGEIAPTFYETITSADNDEDESGLINETTANEREEAIMNALELLPERERLIIGHRFGIYGGEPKTLDQIGNMIGLTRERVRQLERQSLQRLYPLLKHAISSGPSREWSETQAINTAVENRLKNLEARINNIKLKAIQLKLGGMAVVNREAYQQEIEESLTRSAFLSSIKQMYEAAPKDMYLLDIKHDESGPGIEKKILAMIGRGRETPSSYKLSMLKELSKGLGPNLATFVASEEVKNMPLLAYRGAFYSWLSEQVEDARDRLPEPSDRATAVITYALQISNTSHSAEVGKVVQ